MFEPPSLHDGASEIMTIVLYNLSHETEDNNQLNTDTHSMAANSQQELENDINKTDNKKFVYK